MSGNLKKGENKNENKLFIKVGDNFDEDCDEKLVGFLFKTLSLVNFKTVQPFQVDIHGVEQVSSDLYDLMTDRMLGGPPTQVHSKWP